MTVEISSKVRYNHPFVQLSNGTCMLCGSYINEHVVAVSPKVQFEINRRYTKRRNFLRAYSRCESTSIHDVEIETGKVFEGGIGSFNANKKNKSRKLRTVDSDDNASVQSSNEAEDDQKKAERFRKKADISSVAATNNVLRFIGNIKRLPSNKSRFDKSGKSFNRVRELFMDIPVERVDILENRISAWKFDDVCMAVKVSGNQCMKLLDKKMDIRKVPISTISEDELKNYITESGLLRIAIKLRTARSLKFHNWCMEKCNATKEKSAAAVDKQSKELERQAEIASVNPAQIAYKTLEDLIFYAKSTNIWRYYGTQENTVKVYSRSFSFQAKNNFFHMKAQCTINKPVSTILKMISLEKQWPKWDESVENVCMVDKVLCPKSNTRSDTAHILRFTLSDYNPLRKTTIVKGGEIGKMLKGTTSEPRELCVLRNVHSSLKQSAVAFRSISWYTCPKRKRYIRAEFKSSGFLLEPSITKQGVQNNDQTLVTLVYILDLKSTSKNGKIPGFLENHLLMTRPRCLLRLKQILETENVHL